MESDPDLSDPSSPEPLLSVRDLAIFLRVPVGTIYAWRKRGVGPPAHRVGRYLRFRRQDVDTWLDSTADEAPRAR